MSEKLIAEREFQNALEMVDDLEMVLGLNGGEDVYVMDEDGYAVTGFKLVERTLTDGSKVMNVILVRG